MNDDLFSIPAGTPEAEPPAHHNLVGAFLHNRRSRVFHFSERYAHRLDGWLAADVKQQQHSGLAVNDSTIIISFQYEIALVLLNPRRGYSSRHAYGYAKS